MKKITKDGREILTGPHWKKRREECCRASLWMCQQCFKSVSLANGEAHHKVKRGMGGGFRDDRLENLMWLCQSCHREVESQGLRTKMVGK